MARTTSLSRELPEEEPRLGLSLVGGVAKPRVTLGELAYDQLREAILTTRLRPGTPISENELSAAIGVSRTPIREAIRRLAEERLVELTSQHGTTVSRIDADRARQAIFVRQTIECAILEHRGALDEAQLAELEHQVLQHERVIDAGDAIAAARMDDEFHAALMGFCGCPEGSRATRAISGDITRILFLSGANKDYFASVAHDHRRLIDTMRSGDYGGATTLLRKHIGGFAVDQEILRGQSADFFTADGSSEA